MISRQTMRKKSGVHGFALELGVGFKEWNRSTDLKAQDLMYNWRISHL